MAYIAAILVGYLLGCSNMALYISRAKGVDLRSGGSKNLGASNAVTMIGWGAGVITGIHDIGKSVVAVLLAQFLFPQVEYIGVTAGVACIFGHMYPFYLKFRGGKGFASYVGALLALNWKFGLVLVILIAIVALITDFIVAGTTLTMLTAPVYMGLTVGLVAALLFAAASAVILWKHRENYVRMVNGTEYGVRGGQHGFRWRK